MLCIDALILTSDGSLLDVLSVAVRVSPSTPSVLYPWNSSRWHIMHDVDVMHIQATFCLPH